MPYHKKAQLIHTIFPTLEFRRFYEPVVFQPNIIPVCVPEIDEDFIGRTAYVTGNHVRNVKFIHHMFTLSMLVSRFHIFDNFLMVGWGRLYEGELQFNFKFHF